jgi:imidazole glycerol phosphate synthase glutamine amidotransferase subunit
VKVAVIETETSNLASVLAGLRRGGASPHMVHAAAQLEGASALVLPGVGAFGAAMDRLRRCGLVDPLRELLASALEGKGPRVLAVCLGFQLLGSGSDEAPGESGLKLHEGHFEQLPTSHQGSALRVPHLGWNDVVAPDAAGWVRSGAAYFAHSFGLAQGPEGWRAATTEHGPSWVASLERGTVLGTQFHPELSGSWGQALLDRWLEGPPC